MKIIISPAKKMNIREDELEYSGLPSFLLKAEQLKQYIKGLEFHEAKELWACNDSIARLNFERFADMNLERRLTPALLSYEGIQYQYMAPGVFEKKQWDYVQEHLRILSGFYGILKPLDGIVPYRLEMQAKLRMEEGKQGEPGNNKGEKGAGKHSEGSGIRSLYQFWGSSLYEKLREEEHGPCLIINLASKEYSRAIEPFLQKDDRMINCIFGTKEEGKNGVPKIRVKATEAKMARGEMVRFLSMVQAEKEEVLKEFEGLGFRYSEEDSLEGEFVFLKVK